MFNLNKLGTVLEPGTEDEEYPPLYIMLAGAYHNGEYYGYKVRTYSFGIIMPDSWIRVNTTDGSFKILQEMYDLPGAPQWQAKQFTYDLASNPEDGYLYGLVQSDKTNASGNVTSKIVAIDDSDGSHAWEVKQLDEYYFCFAYDYDGKCWGIRWDYNNKGEITGTVLDVMDPEDNYEITRSNTLTVDGRTWKPYYNHSLTFDYTTGDLWWYACDMETNQKLIKIDPLTFATVNKGTPGYAESLVGLYVPFQTADSRTAPCRVEDLSFTIDPNGANKVTLNWTNPTRTWGLRNLKDLDKVIIYRDASGGTPVATLDASGKVGQKMSWTDETATQGVHTYYVVATVTEGELGVERSIEAYVGRDKPGPVNNLHAATPDGKTETLTWEKPTTGDSEGWFDDSDLSYNITRLPDNKDLGTVKTLSFEDKDIPEALSYSYLVTPKSVDGEGTPTESNSVLAGQAVVVPFSSIFDTKVEADRFSIIDKNRDGSTFEWGYNTVRNNRRCMTFLHTAYGNDDILASPVLKVKKGNTYRVKYELTVGGYGDSSRIYLHHFRLVGGKEATAEGMNTVFDEVEEFRFATKDPTQTYTTYFEAPEDGDYYIGLEVLTDGEADAWLYCDAFEIINAPDDDLAIEDVDTHLTLSNQKDNDFTVTVYNNGKNRQDKYKVELATLNYLGEPVVFASTEATAPVESHSTAKVAIKGHPEYTSDHRIVAIVTLEGDGNDDNNVSEPIDVTVDEGEPYTVTVGEVDDRVISTSIPMSFYLPYSASQTIYNPAMTGIEADSEDGMITIDRIAWEYNALDEFEGTKLQVYITQTDREGYTEGYREFIPVTGSPDFDGEVTIERNTSYMNINLDREVKIDPTKPFMVTVTKHETGHSDYISYFRIFDSNWYSDLFHSMRYEGTRAFTPASPTGFEKCFGVPDAPVLHIAARGMKGNSGIGEIVMVGGNAAVVYDAVTKSVVSKGFGIDKVEVFNLGGAKVADKRGNGANSVALDLASGIYLIRVSDARGESVSLKAVVK